MLRERGIRRVIAMGTQAQTSVLHTAAAAALRGFKVIVPVDARRPWRAPWSRALRRSAPERRNVAGAPACRSGS
jgi:nicotinamidase-related amidase